MYEDLEDLIKRSPKPAEVKRGIAVKQDLAGKSRNSIADILSVSVKFISKWRLIYNEYGVDGLISAHQGAKPRAFLTATQKASVLAHIRSQEVFSTAELAAYLKSEFDVSYKSPQSYYDLLHEAGMSWHKSQKQNPKRDEQKVQQRRLEIKKKLQKERKSIKKGETVVIFEDECHLKHGDATGYVWGRKGQRVTVPMLNERHSKTFYGALDLHSREFHLQQYEWANMENTVKFLKWLLEEKYPLAKRIFIIWDGATFHTGQLVKDFLNTVNQGLKQSKWRIQCLLFASNAPDQNPVEDGWLKAKTISGSVFSKT